MMMMMYFHLGLHEVVLFEQWHIHTVGDLALSIVGIIVIGVIYEAIKSYRDHLYVTTAKARKVGEQRSRKALLFSSAHTVHTILHACQLFIGYVLMLIFMTYNVYLCLAVVIGATLGYWLFSSSKSNSENIECCL